MPTQEASLRAMRRLAENFGRARGRLTEAELCSYYLYFKNEKRGAPTSLRLAFYGMRFLYRHVAPRDWTPLERLTIPRSHTLPDVWRCVG